MRRLSAGIRIVQYLVFVTIIVVVVWFLMWVGVVALSVWFVAQGVLRLRARAREIGEAGGAEIANNWLFTGAAAGIVAGLAMLLSEDRVQPWVSWVAGGAVLLTVIGTLAGAGRSVFNRAALAVTIALSGMALLVSVVSVNTHSHDIIAVLTVPDQGDAVTIEDVWAEFGCRPGTEAIDPNLHGNFSYDGSIIVRIGTCELDYRDVEEPSYFFQASSPERLKAWLKSGDLGMDPTLSHWVEMYRDGAVAILNTDGQASYGVPASYLPLPISGNDSSQARFENARAQADEHGRIVVDEVPVTGTANAIEEVWDEWQGCRSGTEVVPADASSAFAFDDSRIIRVGTCVMDDTTKYPTYFFEAASVDAMTDWLMARDLRVVDGTASNAAQHGLIYRDGAVAIVTGSGDARYGIPDMYKPIGRMPLS